VFFILEKYPLLTSRKQCQLDFAKSCLVKKDLSNFIEDRNNKYANKKHILQKYENTNKIEDIPFYFLG
jgi:hypothetical protein